MEFNPTIHEYQPLFFIKTQQNLSISLSSPSPPSSSSGFNNFPILAIALLAIMVTAFLMVSYYIVVIKCCLNWQHFHPLRRFSFTRDRGPHSNESWMGFSSPATEIHRGLDEVVLRDIPTFKYKTKGNNSNNSRSSSFSSSRGERSYRGCAVCLSEFEDQEMLRVLPHCGHIFHLDCIDIWLVNNANCPLCRSSISGVKRSSSPLDHIVAPSSSPQEIIPTSSNQDHDFVVIEIHSSRRRDEIKNERRKLYHHGSMMGDECINVRNKDEDFNVNQPMRRSFSMDSATDRQLLLQVQQIIRHNRHIRNESGSSSNGRSVRRSFFSFGQGQGSKSAILPIQSDL